MRFRHRGSLTLDRSPAKDVNIMQAFLLNEVMSTNSFGSSPIDKVYTAFKKKAESMGEDEKALPYLLVSKAAAKIITDCVEYPRLKPLVTDAMNYKSGFTTFGSEFLHCLKYDIAYMIMLTTGDDIVPFVRVCAYPATSIYARIRLTPSRLTASTPPDYPHLPGDGHAESAAEPLGVARRPRAGNARWPELLAEHWQHG